MALVFISHSHGDEALARKIVTLLRDALDVDSEEFFISSQGGRGVAPAGKIRDEVLRRLAAARSLVVLVTPRSAGSPWLWLEAGSRLGASGTAHPLFVVPSQRFVGLLSPVADLRSICLDDKEDLHEFVKAVGAQLGRAPGEALDYTAAVDDVAAAAHRAYTPLKASTARLGRSVRAHPAALAVLALLLAAAAAVGGFLVSRARAAAVEARQQTEALEAQLAEALTAADEAVNDQVLRTAARYLVLKGVVSSVGNPIQGARVVASFGTSEDPDCSQTDCVTDTTTSEGEFRLDLTKIKAQNGDDVRLSVQADGYQPFSKRVHVDVRVIDVSVPAQTIGLTPEWR